MIGKTLKGYKIMEELGRGGMASIYRSHDLSLDRDVAIKILHPHLCRSSEDRERFEREAKLVARLKHPQIIEIYEYSGRNGDQAYIVTEFIKGKNLKAFVDGVGPLLPEVAAMILLNVCAPLKYAHSMNIVHRDIKPENIMITEDGLLKLTDFGLAQIMDMESLTVTGGIIGSPVYMSPEQVEGKRASVRTDIFAMGTLLYWLSTSRLPFQGTTTAAILKAIAEGKFTDPREINEGISDALASSINRCLQVNPDKRFPNLDSLEKDLKSYLDGSGIVAPESQLKEFFIAPSAYQKGLREKLIAHFLDSGRKLLAKKEFSASLRALEKVLVLDPSCAEARELVTASRRGKRMWSALAATVLIAGCAGAFYFISARIERAAPRMPIDVKEPAVEVKEPAPSQSQPKTPNASVAHAVPPARQEEMKGTLRLTTIPWARVFVDGNYVGETPFVKTVELERGGHDVRLENPFCRPYTERVEIMPGKILDKRVRLTVQEQERK